MIRFRRAVIAALAATTAVSLATVHAAGGTGPEDSVDVDWAERCAANEDAGSIIYLSGFGFAALSSIVEVVVADHEGYFDELCLDVEVLPSFTTDNYPLVAGGVAHFASAGSYTEILNYSGNGAEYVAIVNFGKVPVEGLVTPADGAETLADLEGATIGIKGDLTPSIVAMLANAGLVRGEDYREVLLDGFDPIAHLETGIDALPVYKSNEPGTLDAAGIDYYLFDPADDGIPGSFGFLYTSAEFAAEHPTAVEDFARAALKGMETVLADPDAAAEIVWEAVEGAGNPNFLTLDHEHYRLEHDIEMVVDGTPDGDPVGLIDGDLFRTEYDTYVDLGVWPNGPPDYGEFYDDTIARAVYDDDGRVIWP